MRAREQGRVHEKADALADTGSDPHIMAPFHRAGGGGGAARQRGPGAVVSPAPAHPGGLATYQLKPPPTPTVLSVPETDAPTEKLARFWLNARW
jgi:hypothetical protein